MGRGVYKKTKLIHGVGINDADYVTYKAKTDTEPYWRCPFYERWGSILKRCYSSKYHARRHTYIGCTISEEWKLFSKFKFWMETQDWEGKALDKDLLINGNKVYSKDACIFADNRVNTLLNDNGSVRGKYPIGVYFHKPSGKFKAQCKDGTGSQKSLGYYTDSDQAHQVFCAYKAKVVAQVASEQTDERLKKRLYEISEEIKTGKYYE